MSNTETHEMIPADSIQNESAPAPREKLHDSFEFETSEFETLGKKSWYVDKTMFIKTIFELEDMIMISVPRLFGKSTNMNMLRTFIEIKLDESGQQIKLDADDTGEIKTKQASPNFELFADKKILKETYIFRKYFGTYPVIQADFKHVCGSTYEEYLDAIKGVLNASFKQHSYLLNSPKLSESEKQNFNHYYDDVLHRDLTEAQMKSGLRDLSMYLYKYYGKSAYVLIDDYEHPITKMLYDEKISKEDLIKFIQFIGTIVYNLLKCNDYVDRALINAYHSIVVVGLSSVYVNNIIHYDFSHEEFNQFYGFTKEEVDVLSRTSAQNRINELEHWYGPAMYNTWSVLNYLKTGELNNYWAAKCVSDLDILLLLDEFYDAFRNIMYYNFNTYRPRKRMELDTIESLKALFNSPSLSHNLYSDMFVHYLRQKGYFYSNQFDEWRFYLEISNEVKDEMYKRQCTVSFLTKYRNIEKVTIDKVSESLKRLAQNRCKESFLQLAHSIKNMYCNWDKKKKLYKEILKAHLYCIIKNCFSDTQKGMYGCQISACIREQIGIILEISYNSRAALIEILNNKYYAIFTEKEYANIKNKILIGLHVDGKGDFTISYLCDNMEKDKIETVSTAV